MSDVNMDNFQYIFDHLIKIDWEKDDYGNLISTQIEEPHTITTILTTNEQIIILNKIPDKDAVVKVRNKLNLLSSQQPTFMDYIQATSLPLTSKNQFYFDKTNSRLYFKDVPENQEVMVTYSSIGKALLSSNMVYTEFDSNGNILETLGGLVRESKTALNRLITVSNAEAVRIQLDSQINSLSNIYGIIKNYVPDGKILSAELSTKMPLAQAVTDTLNTAIANAQDDINTINETGNKHYTIQATQLAYNSSLELYEYTLNHNLASDALIISVKDSDKDELLNLCTPIDNNNLLVRNDEKCLLYVTINKSYYGGSQ